MSPSAELVFQQHVGVQVALAVGIAKRMGVQDRRVRLHGGKRVGDDGQRRRSRCLTRLAAASACACRFGHDQGHVVRLPAHECGLRRAARAAQHRLVGHDQPILVDRHVGGGEYGDDAGRGQRGAPTSTARMRAWGTPAKTIFSQAWPGRSMSPGIERGAGHLGGGVDARQAAAKAA